MAQASNFRPIRRGAIAILAFPALLALPFVADATPVHGDRAPQASGGTSVVPAAITILRNSDELAASGEADGETHVVIGRALDLVGNPIDLTRIPRPRLALPQLAGLSGSLPSGMPVLASAMTSGFGYRTHPILGGTRLHAGVDLAAPWGSPVVATASGVVGWAGAHGGYGLLIDILGGGGTETRFGHLSRLNVSTGETVRRGQVIGWSGSTGLSTGPHLHYEVRVNGQAINPVPSLRGGSAK